MPLWARPGCWQAGEEVYWLKAPFSANGKTYPAGTLYIPAKATTRTALDKLAAEIGLSFDAHRDGSGGGCTEDEADPRRPV